MLEAMDAEELKEYARENKDALTTEMNAAIRNVGTNLVISAKSSV
jgi:hypothetical protein